VLFINKDNIMQQISSLEHLKHIAYKENGDFVEFYLLLADGLARSCKRISFRPNEHKQWLIINEIDNSYQELFEKNLAKKTPIVEGINKGAFFLSNMP
jgi:hypothetical protein